jgi:hypothetical protein
LLTDRVGWVLGTYTKYQKFKEIKRIPKNITTLGTHTGRSISNLDLSIFKIPFS